LLLARELAEVADLVPAHTNLLAREALVPRYLVVFADGDLDDPRRALLLDQLLKQLRDLRGDGDKRAVGSQQVEIGEIRVLADRVGLERRLEPPGHSQQDLYLRPLRRICRRALLDRADAPQPLNIAVEQEHLGADVRGLGPWHLEGPRVVRRRARQALRTLGMGEPIRQPALGGISHGLGQSVESQGSSERSLQQHDDARRMGAPPGPIGLGRAPNQREIRFPSHLVDGR
jgi:hypothetical protein